MKNFNHRIRLLVIIPHRVHYSTLVVCMIENKEFREEENKHEPYY